MTSGNEVAGAAQTNAVMDALLQQASRYVATNIGLEFPPSRWSDLERGLRAASRQLGYRDLTSCIHCLLSSSPSRAQIQTLAAHLAIGETYFFRDPQIFHVLESVVLPGLIEQRRGERRLRIWSAGCSSGEEPYSIAMLLDRLLPKDEVWEVTILATDINAVALEKARSGTYTEWSFRGTPAWVKHEYFEAQSGRYQLSSRIRRMVTFSFLNLMEDPYPALVTNTTAMDIIFCRNVLMYFSPERAAQVVEKIHRALRDQGWLVVSPSELSYSLFPQFSCFHHDGAILYRKAETANPTPSNSAMTIPLKVERRPTPVLPVPHQSWDIDDCVAAPDETSSFGPPARPHRPVLLEGSVGQTDATSPEDAESAALQARVHANQGRLADALECCRRALAADKLNASHHYLLGLVLQELGHSAEALDALRHAIYLNQDFVMAHFTLSGIAEKLGRAREGKRHRQAALALLQAYEDHETLPESEGITAARLAEIIGQRGVLA